MVVRMPSMPDNVLCIPSWQEASQFLLHPPDVCVFHNVLGGSRTHTTTSSYSLKQRYRGSKHILPDVFGICTPMSCRFLDNDVNKERLILVPCHG